MIAAIITVIYLIAWVVAWRRLQARSLEKKIQANRDDPHFDFRPSTSKRDRRRGYTNDDIISARFFGCCVGLIWPVVLPIIGLRAVVGALRLGQRWEIVPPSEKARRASEQVRQMQREIDKRNDEIAGLERQLNLPSTPGIGET